MKREREREDLERKPASSILWNCGRCLVEQYVTKVDEQNIHMYCRQASKQASMYRSKLLSILSISFPAAINASSAAPVDCIAITFGK